jgi:hypothetical protein
MTLESTQSQSPSLYELMRVVLTDQTLEPGEKKDLIDELRRNNPGPSDRWTYRYAILILGGAVLLTIASLLLLSWYDSKVPEGLVAIGSASAGGLAGLLSPGRSKEPNEH